MPLEGSRSRLAGPGRHWNHKTMRVVGKRKTGKGDRRALDALVTRFGGGAPKGVFRYKSAEEAKRDQERWMIERVQQRTKMSNES